MPGIREVAQRAGVSVATASRVFNQTAPVSPELTERVLQAARELGYSPARSRLGASPGKTIGLCVPNVSQHPFFADVVRGVEDVCSSAGYTVILCNTDRFAQKERTYLHMLRHRRVAGLVIIPVSGQGDHIRAILGEEFPIVLVDRRLEDLDAPAVLIDNVATVRRAVDYLLGLGHRRIGFIIGEPDLPMVQDRCRGYQEALQAHGLEPDPRLLAMGVFAAEWGYEATVQFFSRPDPPTAILSGSLSLTQGTLLALQDLNLRIPEDVSVLAFDDIVWFRLLQPPLTAIAQPAYRMGSVATEILLAMLETGEPPREKTLFLETQFRLRQSCAAPREEPRGYLIPSFWNPGLKERAPSAAREAMTPKERTLAAIEHREPDRVPVYFTAVPEQVEALRRHFGVEPRTDLLRPIGFGDWVEPEVLDALGVDVRHVWPRYVGPPLERREDGTFRDLWGTWFKVVRHATGAYNEAVALPLAEARTVHEVERHAWPRVEWFDFSAVREQCERFRDYAIVVGWPANVDFINRAARLCGYERVLVGLATGDPVVLAIFDQISRFFLEFNQRFFEAAQGYASIAFYGDDYGGQTGSLISPRTYRAIFQPRWEPHIAQARAFGLKVMLHSCGSTCALMPDLIDTGFDVIQTVQPEAQGMDLAELKARFGDRLCFNGAISVQQVLPRETPEGVRREVRRVIGILAPGGGYILGPTHNIQSDTPLENILAMYEAAKEYGKYPIQA
jgi:uroporphyrinogen decarboxylase